MEYKFVIVGGGISGVTCAETLSALNPDDSVLVITSSPVLKAVTNLRHVSKTLEKFDVEEKPVSYLEENYPNVKVIEDNLVSIDSGSHLIQTATGLSLKYEKLCLCTGGKPKLIETNNPNVVGIRDTESVKVFREKLEKADRVMIVGNGGIATELAYEIEDCEVVWAIKDSSISATFVDAGAAEYFISFLNAEKDTSNKPCKRLKYSTSETALKSMSASSLGSALGPDWSTGLDIKGARKGSRHVHVEYKVEVKKIMTEIEFKESGKIPETITENGECSAKVWPCYVELTNGKVYGCNAVISATGVIPNTDIAIKNEEFKLGVDGGILVDNKLETSVNDIFAAGDVCSAGWEPAPHWFQMRLWTQARQMGFYAAKSMIASTMKEDIDLDFCFEIFSHVTQFFNHQVILLGKYNAQGLGSDYELLLRVTPGKEYVKTVMQNGRMQGAVLIGETELEETFENLILNQMDLSIFGEDLLSPDIDIEDYFD